MTFIDIYQKHLHLETALELETSWSYSVASFNEHLKWAEQNGECGKEPQFKIKGIANTNTCKQKLQVSTVSFLKYSD